MLTISGQLAGRIPVEGGTAARIVDLSNTRRLGPASSTRRKPGRRLTHSEVWDSVFRFLESGDPQDLPPAFRPEASGIFTMFVNALAAGPPPGPPPPWLEGLADDATPDEVLRAAIGARADEPSGIEADDGS